MTALELIDKLKGLPSEIKIVVAGYEEGYNDIQELTNVILQLNTNKEWYYGAHKESNTNEGVKAIALIGKNHNSNEE